MKKTLLVIAILAIAILGFNFTPQITIAETGVKCQLLATQITDYVNKYGSLANGNPNYKSDYDTNGDKFITSLDVLSVSSLSELVCDQKLGNQSSVTSALPVIPASTGLSDSSMESLKQIIRNLQIRLFKAEGKLSKITVVSPNGGETLEMGKTYKIKWNSSGYNKNYYSNISLINLDDFVIGQRENGFDIGTPDIRSGSYDWKIPSTETNNGGFSLKPGKNYMIRVQMIDRRTREAVGGDFSDKVFSIVPSITQQQATLKVNITPENLSKAAADIVYINYPDGKGMTNSTTGSGVFNMPTGSTFLLKPKILAGYTSNISGVCAIDKPGVVAGQTYNCNIDYVSASMQPSITVTSPSGGETWKVGETHNITWKSSGVAGSVGILSHMGGNYSVITNFALASSGSFSWTIPSTFASGQYTISISGYPDEAKTSGTGTQVFSNIFTIVANQSPVAAITSSPRVDLKINNSDGPITVKTGEYYKLSWLNSGVSSCKLIFGDRAGSITNMSSASGLNTLSTTSVGSYKHAISCTGTSDGKTYTDSVTVNVIARVSFSEEDQLASISDAIMLIADQIKELMNR